VAAHEARQVACDDWAASVLAVVVACGTAATRAAKPKEMATVENFILLILGG